MTGYTPTPDFYNEYICHSNLSDDELIHYGVKGMKWRRRKTRTNKKKGYAKATATIRKTRLKEHTNARPSISGVTRISPLTMYGYERKLQKKEKK